MMSILVAISPATAQAYCAGWDTARPNYDPHYYSVATEFRRSKYVVKAKVVRESWIGESGKVTKLRPPFQDGRPRPWGFDPYLGAFYDLRVERAFKGHSPAMIRLFSENSTARFWLLPGQEILGFVAAVKFDRPIGRHLTLDTCGNFDFFPKAQRLIPAVVKAAAERH